MLNEISLNKASVIMRTYNQEDTIAQAIESVLAQQCDFKYEIIIGEDCGNDNTRNICIDYQSKFPHIIKLVLFEKNVGLVKNWIACIQESTGKYITSCSGDDYWHNTHKLKLQVDYMESNPECGVLHTDYHVLNVNKNKIYKSVLKNKNSNIKQGFECQEAIFKGQLSICAPTVCFRKLLFDKYIPVNDYITLNFPIEDWPTWIIFSKYSKIDYLPISTLTYRKGHESASNLLGYEKVIKKYALEKILYKYICNLFPESFQYDENHYEKYINSILLNIAYKKFDFSNAKKYGKLNYNSFKVKCSQNYFTFLMFCLCKKFNIF